MAEEIELTLQDPDQELAAEMEATLRQAEAAVASTLPIVPFVLDGEIFKVRIPAGGIKRSAQILDGENAGRTTQSGRMKRDVIGTFYNFSMQIDTSELDPAAYDRFYDFITAPVDSHTCTFPCGQRTITGEYYITGAEDVLDAMDKYGNHWSGLTANFIAMDPARTPG